MPAAFRPLQTKFV